MSDELVPPSSGSTAPSADLLLVNGHLWSDGSWREEATAVAIVGRQIAAIGNPEELDVWRSPATQIIDVDGRWVLPGFQDSHVHPLQAGLELNACALDGEDDAAGYLATIAQYAAAHPDAEWILGGGWSMHAFPHGIPTAAPLDDVVPDRPVFLPNRDHHSAWVNSAALNRAGITRDTPDPPDGRIERDADGNPTGALHEGAMGLVSALVPDPTDADLLDALLTAQRYLHSLGITAWQDALVGEGLGMRDSLDAYLAAQRDGLLTADVVLSQWWDRTRGEEQIADLVERRARAAAAGVDAGTVKIMQDGVCETFTAAVIDPYLDGQGQQTHNHGITFIPAEDLARYVQLLDAADFQAHIHALGDRAVRDSLDAIAHARAINGNRGNRHHLAHVQIIHPDDVPRFADLGVTANAQPLWACLDEAMADLTLPFLSDEARGQQYVFRSLLSSGARLAFGSDWPVSSPDPWGAMHVAVNRAEPGAEATPLLGEEALSIVESIDAYTRGSAWVNRRDQSSGVIEAGRVADLVVLDRDPLLAASGEIASIRVTHTIAGGRLVYEH